MWLNSPRAEVLLNFVHRISCSAACVRYSQIIGRLILIHCATRKSWTQDINIEGCGGFKEERVFDSLSELRPGSLGKEGEARVAEVTSGSRFPGHREADFGARQGHVFTAAGLPRRGRWEIKGRWCGCPDLRGGYTGERTEP